MATADNHFEPISYLLSRQDKRGFARQLGRSVRETGFAVINDHGLDPTVLDRGVAAARAFFALPDPVKRSYFEPALSGQRGYTPFGVEVAKGAVKHDLKEFWHVGRELPEDDPQRAVMPDNLYVAEIPGWKATTGAMFDALDSLGVDILSAIALDLDLPPRFFDDSVRNGNSILRMLHYPAQPAPPAEGSVRAGAHEDINVITLLLGAEEGGLEVRHRNGQWLGVNPPPGSLVVNIGDMLQRQTNNVLPSTSHRVVNPKPERSRFARYSTPYFLHFRPDYEIRTLPGCMGSDRPDLYPEPINAQDFLLQRLKEIGLKK
ncbi:MAG: 2-oxoglutarate and iron-dependent oxygenase domain-containing protein [Alphaproteobacteria bacterium]|nr:2-oxoglutarate and iron-dependent oxygenase domain-containing protein [Alphaproteobacteria bacterium]